MRSLIKFCLRLGISVLALSLPSCLGPKVPDGRIMVRNDTDDTTYNRINVSGAGVDSTLRPGENVLLPSSTLRFTVTRAYKDYTRSYTVECPPVEGSGISIRLIDIHVNRIAGNCVTVDASKY